MSPQYTNFAQSLPELYSAVARRRLPSGRRQHLRHPRCRSRLDAMAYGGEGRGERLVVGSRRREQRRAAVLLDERGHVAGVAFSSYAGSADNIGHLVPASVVEAFLRVAVRCTARAGAGPAATLGRLMANGAEQGFTKGRGSAGRGGDPHYKSRRISKGVLSR